MDDQFFQTRFNTVLDEYGEKAFQDFSSCPTKRKSHEPA